MKALYRVVVYSRLSDKIFVKLGSFKAREDKEFQSKMSQFGLEDIFGQSSCYVESTVSSKTSAIRESKGLLLTTGVMRRIHEPRSTMSQFMKVRIRQNEVTLFADCTGVELHKRGYRENSLIKMPIRETLACFFVNHVKDKPIFDPFCGTGTLLFEAAAHKIGLVPGLLRERFAGDVEKIYSFENWKIHKADMFKQVLEEAREKICTKPQETIFVGSDRDKDIIKSAEIINEKLGFQNLIKFETSDIQSSSGFDFMNKSVEDFQILSNPPWGPRSTKILKPGYTLGKLYSQFGTTLKNKAEHKTFSLVCPANTMFSKMLQDSTKFKVTRKVKNSIVNGNINLTLLTGIVAKLPKT